MNKRDVLTTALNSREEEVLMYDVNIQNYERALQKAREDNDLQEFCVKLTELLQTSQIERKKALIMRDVIKEQLEG